MPGDDKGEVKGEDAVPVEVKLRVLVEVEVKLRVEVLSVLTF